MSIVAECPHCETRFNLQPDLVGKAMRCPNPNCREPFVVREVGRPANATPAQPAAPPARPGQVTGTVGELVPVVEAEVVAPAAPPPRPSPPKPPKPPRRPVSPDLPVIFDAEPVEEPQVVDAVPVTPAAPPKPPKPPEPQVVDAVVVAPAPAPKEVVWSAGADIPPPPQPGAKRKPVRAEAAKAEPDDSVDDLILTRRKKRSNRGPVILIGMIVTLLFVGGAIGLYLLKHEAEVESKDAQAAEELLKGADYAKAAKTYEKLAADYPDSKDAEKYRFLADLTAMRAAAWSVGNRENPRPTMDKLKAFIEAQKSSPFAKPGRDTYGNYIFEAGRKVTDDITDYAKDRVKDFQGERSRAKQDELKKAEDMLAAGRDFLGLLSPFRTKDDKTLEELGKPFDGVKAEIARERRRLDVLDQVRDLLKNLSESNIQEAKALLRKEGLADDPEAGGLLAAAEGSFVRMARYERDPAAPQPPPAPAAASLLFVARVGTDKPANRGGLTDAHPPAVFLAVARGVLYALDEDGGDLLWAARVGADTFDPPTVAHAQLAEGPTELAVVTSNVAGQPAVSGFVLRTGMARWSQPLPAPAAGPAAVIGARAFVPVKDSAGSVFVFDLTTGMRAGRIVLGQPVGPGAVARPGTNQLYVAAESRRVYVFDVDAGTAGGEPQCVRVIPTEHPTGSLVRTMPVILGPAGDAPAPRWLVLAQADGPTAMNLRAFPLPPTPVVAPDAPPVLEPLAPDAELPLTGWAWFPPVSDGEQLAVITDQGQFRLFGINQPGNVDKALFPYPHPNLPAPPDDSPAPGLVVPAEEGAFWALVNGSLLKFRLTLNPERGLTLVPAGTGFPVGIPTQPAQLNPRRDTACFVVRSANSSGCRAVAVRLLDGEPRWQRQLGVIPAAAPARTETGLLLVDEDGGAVAVPAAGAAISDMATKAAPEWVIAAPVDDVSGPTRVVTSADGKTVFTVTPTGSGPTAKWVIRRFTGGKQDHAGSVTAPAPLAGQPVAFNDSLLLPAADGSIYRLTPGDGRSRKDQLTPGPKWWLDRRAANPACFLLPLSGDTFLASDGGKVLKRWSWPAGGWVDDGMKWEIRQPIAAPPLLLPPAGGKPARLLVADTTGGIWLYGLDRTDPPLRRWVPGKTVALPGGKVSSGFAVQTDPAGRQLAAYAVDGKHLVCLNADADQPRWVISAGDDPGRAVVGSPHPMGDGRWLVTDLSGRVSVLDADTGRATVTREVGLPGAVAQTPAVPVGDSRVLVPLSDGSAAVVELQDKGKQPEAKKE